MEYKFNDEKRCKQSQFKFKVAYNYRDLENLIFDNKKISQGTLNTLNYMFYKMKNGIFVSIKNNKIFLFVPFSNENYVNEWSHLVKLNNKYKNYTNYVNKKIKIHNIKNRKYYEIENNKTKWSLTGCLLRHEKEHKPNPTYWSELYDIIKETCLNKKIKDIDFFINKKDIPILKRDLTEPLDKIWGKIPLISHKYKQYAPILSQSTTEKYFDKAMVNSDDWDLITQKYFVPICKNNYIQKLNYIKWKDRKATAIFRGSATGCGMTTDDNQRLKISKLDYEWDNDLLDAGITRFIKRSKITKNGIDFIYPNNFNFKLKPFMSLNEQLQYKYIINIEGNAAAYRLSNLLRMKSVILDVESEYYVWFKSLMKPMVHYIPIKSDLSDLKEKILWCRKNDLKCKKIAENSYKFYKKYITKEYVYKYMSNLLNKLDVITV